MDQHLSASSIESEADRVERAKTGTRLANEMAAAGAAYLAHMRTAGGIAAIPGTNPQQYVVAGTLAMIGQVLPREAAFAAAEQPAELTEAFKAQVRADFEALARRNTRGNIDLARHGEESVFHCGEYVDGNIQSQWIGYSGRAAAELRARQSPAPIPENAGAPISAEDAALIARQVRDWTKERDRLQDLIDTATGKSGAPIPEQVAQASEEVLSEERIFELGAKLSPFQDKAYRDEQGHPLTFPERLRVESQIEFARAIEREVLATQSAKQGARQELPAILFDGHAVYAEVMANDPHTPRPTADNICDVLDAVVRLMRKEGATQAPVQQVPAEQVADIIMKMIGACVLNYHGGAMDADEEDFSNEAHERAYLVSEIERIDRASTAGAEGGA